MEEEFNFEEDMEIDVHALHEELAGLAGKHAKYSKQLVKAKKRLLKAEQKVKVTRSKLTLDATRDPEKTLGEGIKATALPIEAYYRTHKDHKEAKEEWIEAQDEVNSLESAIFSINKKDRDLENLVKLYGMQYFVEPNVPLEFNTRDTRKKIIRDKIRRRRSK